MKKLKLAFLSEYSAAKKVLLGEKSQSNYLQKIDAFFEKNSQLLSSQYTHVAFLKLFLPPSKEVIIVPENNICSSCYTRFPDGTRIFSVAQEATTSKEPDLASISGIQQYTSDYG